ncbi:9671_t:CDS:1, partial [Rhizophagus irregularis]
MNWFRLTAEDYGKTPYMVQLIETSREKITEIIQAEFNRKGSQLKTRIVVYCTRTVEGEISITYIDKYHDGEIQVLPIKSFNGYFLLGLLER